MRVLMLQSWRSPQVEIDVTPGGTWKRTMRNAIAMTVMLLMMPIAVLALMAFALAALGLTLVAVIGTSLCSTPTPFRCRPRPAIGPLRSMVSARSI